MGIYKQKKQTKFHSDKENEKVSGDRKGLAKADTVYQS